MTLVTINRVAFFRVNGKIFILRDEAEQYLRGLQHRMADEYESDPERED